MLTFKYITHRVIPGILAALTVSITCAAATGDQAQAFTLMLGDYQFSPDTFEISAGQPVVLTLTNTDGITPHNFVMNDAPAGMEIDVSVSAGKTKTIEFTPTIPGSYTFYCSKKLPFMKSHRQKGMEGTLVVK